MNDKSQNVLLIVRKAFLTKWYWALLVVLGIFMEAVALYYQYIVGDEPCQICIHTRIWVAGFTLLALIMCLLPRWRILNIGAHFLCVGAMLGFWERCRYLLNVESGKGSGSCEFFLGFPDWFALDKWFPFMFEVRNLCGFTPEIFWGISMAQCLMVVAWVLLIGSVIALGLNIAQKAA